MVKPANNVAIRLTSGSTFHSQDLVWYPRCCMQNHARSHLTKFRNDRRCTELTRELLVRICSVFKLFAVGKHCTMDKHTFFNTKGEEFKTDSHYTSVIVFFLWLWRTCTGHRKRKRKFIFFSSRLVSVEIMRSAPWLRGFFLFFVLSFRRFLIEILYFFKLEIFVSRVDNFRNKNFPCHWCRCPIQFATILSVEPRSEHTDGFLRISGSILAWQRVEGT